MKKRKKKKKKKKKKEKKTKLWFVHISCISIILIGYHWVIVMNERIMTSRLATRVVDRCA